MGSKLVTSALSSNFACKTDADCTTKYTSATKAKTCCQKYDCLKSGSDSATYKALGWPYASMTYLKICNTDYPAFVTTYKPKDSQNLFETTGGGIYQIYCDGGAMELAISAAAATAVISMY